MSSAAQFLRGIDLSMTLLCLLNLALIIDSFTSHHLPPGLPASAASAYLSCVIYCLFNLVTLLVILIIRSLPHLCRAVGNESLAASCYAIQLGIQLFLLLPRTLIVLSLLSTVLRARVLLLGDPAHTVFYLSSALLLFVYSCAILILDCQRVQRWTASTTAPRPARSSDDVRVFSVSMFTGPLWPADTSAHTRGLSELEIDRVTTLTTFTPAPIADKRTEDEVGEEKAVEVAQTEVRVAVLPAREQQLTTMCAEEPPPVNPPHYENPPPPPPSPAPPEPAQQTVSSAAHSSPWHRTLTPCLTTERSECVRCVLLVVSCLPRDAASRRVGVGVAMLGTPFPTRSLILASMCSMCPRERVALCLPLRLCCLTQHLYHPSCIRPWLRRNQACPSQQTNSSIDTEHALLDSPVLSLHMLAALPARLRCQCVGTLPFILRKCRPPSPTERIDVLLL